MRPLKQIVGTVALIAFCLSPTMAAAATPTAFQPINPLIAVSAFGTPASAQAVCTEVANLAATAGTVVAAQGQTGCVLPVTDVPPPV
jgi:hypothetical protein